jgi:hypothetical protein
MPGGPFSTVRTLAGVVFEDGCKKSAHFLNAYFDLCALATLILSVPAGAMVKLRTELAWRLVEELAATAGQNREKTRNMLLKKIGELLAQLRRDLGDGIPSEALMAKLTELFLKELA